MGLISFVFLPSNRKPSFKVRSLMAFFSDFLKYSETNFPFSSNSSSENSAFKASFTSANFWLRSCLEEPAKAIA